MLLFLLPFRGWKSLNMPFLVPLGGGGGGGRAAQGSHLCNKQPLLGVERRRESVFGAAQVSRVQIHSLQRISETARNSQLGVWSVNGRQHTLELKSHIWTSDMPVIPLKEYYHVVFAMAGHLKSLSHFSVMQTHSRGSGLFSASATLPSVLVCPPYCCWNVAEGRRNCFAKHSACNSGSSFAGLQNDLDFPTASWWKKKPCEMGEWKLWSSFRILLSLPYRSVKNHCTHCICL